MFSCTRRKMWIGRREICFHVHVARWRAKSERVQRCDMKCMQRRRRKRGRDAMYMHAEVSGEKKVANKRNTAPIKTQISTFLE
jgi:hypothetical protein